ncbi:MAG: response regulator [Longimicrobiales bacterium]|nr:response regulator [Longimicrobiales bacterium]
MTGPGTPGGGLAELAAEELLEARILIVDDEPGNLRVLERLLNRVGYERIRTTDDSRQVESLFEEFRPDLVLLDLHMPHLDGFEIMEMLEERIPSDVFLPILVLTGDTDPDTKRRALSVGAKDFVGKPFESTEALLRIKNLLETRALHEELRAYSETLEQKVRHRTRELAEAQTEILHRLALAAEYRDDVTGRHAERVGAMSALVAQVLGLSDQEVKVIRRAAPLHDVGKIGIPDAILMKPGALTPQEFEVMKSHTTIGERILSGTDYPLLETARVIALYHHEKWDGSGYQPGMTGEDIPLVGRIVAAADAFDCLTHERPYKDPESTEEATEEIRQTSGSHFDPRVADALLQVVESMDGTPIDRLVEVPVEVLTRGPEVVAEMLMDRRHGGSGEGSTSDRAAAS